MKAFLLAAGLGTRLRPLTDTVPKCLVTIKERPLLSWWLELLDEHGIDEVIINTHYLAQPVSQYIAAHNGSGKKPKAIEFYEPVLLGSAGTVMANREFVKEEDCFLICYADNLTDIDLTAIIETHKKNDAKLTMALFRTPKPEQCGIAHMDSKGKIIKFTEKPEKPESNLANGGIYVADTEILDAIPDTGFSDFGKDVLPKLVGDMYGWETQSFILDIGTPENYENAQKEWKK